MAMTYMESEIIKKRVDVKCHIKVILFCVLVLIAEVRKKGESDVRLNNPDVLSCSSHFYADSCSRQVIKNQNRIDWDIKNILL